MGATKWVYCQMILEMVAFHTSVTFVLFVTFGFKFAEKSGSLKAQKNLRKRLNKMEKRKQHQKQARTGGGINSKINAVKTAKKQKMIERKTAKGSMPPHSLQSKPVFNTEGKVVFSKFDFAQGEKPDKSKTKKVSLKTQLVQAREKQAKKAAGGGGAADKEAWDAAMRKAAGERLKDDPKLIAKTIRRERQKKKQSQKKWQERRESEVQKREEKQGKREANINRRKEQKQKKVIDKLKKKGRILPGF